MSSAFRRAQLAEVDGGIGFMSWRGRVMRPVTDRQTQQGATVLFECDCGGLGQLDAQRFGFHFCRRATMMLRMTISLRMQATSATFFSFPLPTKR